MLTQLRADTPLPILWACDARDRHRRRADVRGVPAGRPEQRAGPPDRRRGQQPVVLPAGRRHGGPRDHGHGVRDVADARDPVRAGVGGGAAAGRRRARLGRWRCPGLTGVGDMGAAILASLPARGAGRRGAVHPGDRRGDPPGVLDRDGLARSRSGSRPASQRPPSCCCSARHPRRRKPPCRQRPSRPPTDDRGRAAA